MIENSETVSPSPSLSATPLWRQISPRVGVLALKDADRVKLNARWSEVIDEIAERKARTTDVFVVAEKHRTESGRIGARLELDDLGHHLLVGVRPHDVVIATIRDVAADLAARESESLEKMSRGYDGAVHAIILADRSIELHDVAYGSDVSVVATKPEPVRPAPRVWTTERTGIASFVDMGTPSIALDRAFVASLNESTVAGTLATDAFVICERANAEAGAIADALGLFVNGFIAYGRCTREALRDAVAKTCPKPSNDLAGVMRDLAGVSSLYAVGVVLAGKHWSVRREML
jgi:hypothetical protein